MSEVRREGSGTYKGVKCGPNEGVEVSRRRVDFGRLTPEGIWVGEFKPGGVTGESRKEQIKGDVVNGGGISNEETHNRQKGLLSLEGSQSRK